MLSAFLLAGLIAVPIATIVLFTWRVHAVNGHDGRLRWGGRLLGAVLWGAALGAGAPAVLLFIGATQKNAIACGIGLFASSICWLPATRRWSATAHACWSATVFLFLSYLVFMLWWTFASHLGVAGTIGGVVLWVLELFAGFLGCVYLWELCDTLGRAAWLRRIGPNELAERSHGGQPFACLQVPCYNEPPQMVIATLESLEALDYPNYEVVVLDDNSDDEALWRPVERWCADHGFKFKHLENWPGYKSGALNYALRNLVDERAEIIAVIDSDYQIDPSFLSACAPLFDDPEVGFVQAPQDYRDWEGAPFYRRLYYSYQYFFAVSQPSRNERDGAIFAGTMGLIRRSALEQVGGWDEWCITEDAELSLRVLAAGWTGYHVDRSFGRGIMPLTFEALKGQRFRWCFGGIQILREHWRLMMPGRRRDANRLALGQRWAYLSGAFQWYGDLLALIFYGFLLLGAANIAFSGGLLFRKLTGFLLAAIPVLVLLGLLRAVALLRRGTGATWGEAFGAFLIWQSTSLTVARASLQALFAKQAAFLRTPKTAGEAKLLDAIWANWAECLLAVLGLAAIGGALSRHSGYGGPLIAGLLVWPTVSFVAAPLNSFSAQRASLPPELAERRRTEHLRAPARRLTYALGGISFAGAMAVVAVGLMVPGPQNIVPPQLVGPASGHPAHYGSRTSPKPTTPLGPTGSRSTTTTAPNGVTGTSGNSGNSGVGQPTGNSGTGGSPSGTSGSSSSSTTSTSSSTTSTTAAATTSTTTTTTTSTTTTTTTTVP